MKNWKFFLFIGGLVILVFSACKEDSDDTNVFVPLPTVPSGQYRLEKMEFRNSDRQLVEVITPTIDSTQYFYYKTIGEFKKVVTIYPTECIDNWPDFMDTFGGLATFDSTQFFPTVNGIILHFYLGWQGVDDREFLLYYLTKSDHFPADTVTCN